MEPTKKIRVVFYARVSTEHEAQINAFDNQIEWYKAELLKLPEWELIDIYSDKGVTGTSAEKRPGSMQMYADAHLGRFDKIVTRELSRFARNIEEAVSYARKFARLEVSIYFLHDNIDTANAGDMTYRYASAAGMAQEESRKISDRAKDGQKSLIFDGGIVCHRHLTIPQSFCFAKIQPPLHKGAFFLSFRLRLLGLFFLF